jgi:hypothetical protein
LLAAAAIAVLGMGVYLFIQVRATPAQAEATAGAPSPPPNQTAQLVQPVAPKPEAKPEEPPVPGSTKTSWTRTPLNDVKPSAEPIPSLANNETDDRKVDLKVDNMMELANKAYDGQDFDQAVAIAGKVLAKDPNNVRMLRIMVSANCIQGDSAIAQQHYEKLPKFDREQMKTRCDRYGVTFKEP